MKKAPPTPNLERLDALKDEYGTQDIGEFLEWMEACGITPCFWSPFTESFEPTGKSVEDLLYEYVGIDKNACEKEREALIKYVREVQQEIS